MVSTRKGQKEGSRATGENSMVRDVLIPLTTVVYVFISVVIGNLVIKINKTVPKETKYIK